VSSAQGAVRVQHSGSDEWERLRRKSTICEGDTIRTGYRSRAAVNLSNESVIRIKQQSKATLENFSPKAEAKSVLRMLSGVLQFFSRKPREYSIATTTATIGIRGTEFVVTVDDQQTGLTVFEGEVEAENDLGPIALSGGESVRIVNGQTMRVETPVNPRDQVQWGLYYPPVIALADEKNTSLEPANDCLQTGDYVCAFDALDSVDDADRDAGFRVFQASLLLAVGDVEQALVILEQLKADGSRVAPALALSAIIGITQNRLEDASRDASEALRIDPDSVAALIAQSYVQQASLDLNAARDTLLSTVARHPQNALAHARLAELSLAVGETTDSRESAERAIEIDPSLSRAHMVLGYAALSQIDTDTAIAEFETALDLDSADPMSHLGLGLGLIRDGNLVSGRKEIESAVALDSNKAVLRTYLGRAYYEEKRAPLDAEQYAIAKQLDPNDPTAYLFDALRLHSENRPVESLQDLEASIARNDNRAVYRSRNLLDQDRAARGASLARVYDSLGFTSQGSNEAGKSLAIDPANDSAHRFLSDNYRDVRRREIARVSELLQAQMLQDINLNPVQPSVSATNLNLGSGAGDVGLNEFTNLFERNQVQLGLSGQAGSNDTKAGEAVISGVYDSLSFSLGGFHHETDGWRDNNAQDQDLANLFVQWAATPKLNLQFEISSRDSTEGDLAFNFDPDNFDPTLTKDIELDTERFGLRYSLNPGGELLVSHISSERIETQEFDGTDLVFDPFAPSCPPVCLSPVPGVFDITLDEDGTQNEIQYIQQLGQFNFIIGFADADVDSDLVTATNNPGSVVAESSESEFSHERAYLYSTVTLKNSVDLTLGVSQDDYEEEPTDESETNGKFGLRWQFGDRQQLRLAALEVMKPALVNNRTLEPTQVAGFNQLFDDTNGTQSELIGLGYDIALTANVSLGLEVTEREMDEPVITDVGFGPETVFEDREETIQRIYIHWTPSKRTALSLEAIVDEYEADPGIVTVFDGLPEEVNTTSFPLSIKYFSESGWFAGATITSVDQEVVRNTITTLTGGEDQFEVLDLSLGYRIPNRRGSISLLILNATDEEFMYQDDSFREFRDEPSTGPYYPERTAYLTANLVF
jgi:tetratricopeptide (TPR) repeat protein